MRGCTLPQLCLFLTLSMGLAACNDLSIILNAPPKAANFQDKIVASINSEGQLQLDWSAAIQSKSRAFDIYLIKEARSQDRSIATEISNETLLTTGYLNMKFEESPKAMGTLVATVEGSTYTYPDIMDQDSRYLFHIGESSRSKMRSEQTVFLTQIDFPNLRGAQASPTAENKVLISWEPVPGATSYDVCLDADGTVIATTSETELVVDQVAAHYWIRSKRGQLVAKEMIKVGLNASSAKIEALVSLSPDAVYTSGDTLEFDLRFSDKVSAFGETFIAFDLEGRTARANYQSGNGSDHLIFRYVVQAGDNVAHLKPTAEVVGEIADTAGLRVSGSLPGAGSVFISKHHLSIDTLAPTAPSSVAFNQSISKDGQTSLAWASGEDAHFKTDLYKLCADNACSSACGVEMQSIGGPVTITGLAEGEYFACVKTQDVSSLNSAWISSFNGLTVDKTAPRVLQLSSTLADGTYSVGQNIPITVLFSEPVFLTGTAQLALTIGASATYVSGSGSSTLSFQYTVGAGQNINSLDALGINALSVTGTLYDGAGHSADLVLPASGQGKRLAESKNIVIDTLPPVAPHTVAFTQALFAGSYLTATWTHGSDTNFKQHNVKLCTAADCSSNCRAAESSLSSPKSLLGVSGTSYYACVQSEDASGQTSAWVPSAATAASDSDAPAVQSVDSSLNAGIYKANDVLTIDVHFSENVTVSNGADIRLLLEMGATDGLATYVSGSGSNSLTFSYTIQAGDNSPDLNYQSRNALSMGATGRIRDASGNDANLLLPDLSDSGALSSQEALIVDTIVPTAPTAVAFSSNHSIATSVSFSWNASTDANFRYHNIKLCTALDCATGCLAPATANASPASLSGAAGSTYYACVQGEDMAGQSTAWVPSSNSVSIDNTAPSIQSVAAVTANGLYKAGTAIDMDVVFSENVNVLNEGSLLLLLETGASDHSASYLSGTGTNTLRFRYTIQAGDTSPDLNYQNTTALSLNSLATVRDAAGNNAILTLPGLGDPSALAGQAALVVDTTSPTAPALPSFAGPTGQSLTFPLSWTDSSDDHFKTHQVKLCTGSNCSTGCSSSLSSATSPATMTGVNGGIYYGCVQGEDNAGNLSAWVATATTHTVDTSNPTITSVSASTADGIYKAGDSLSVQVVFSKVVTVTGGADIKLLLEMGGTDREATFSSGSGSNTLTFSYSIQAGDSSSDLDYASTTALDLGASGDIEDAGAHNAVLTLPALGSAQSIAGQKAIIVDTTAPTNPSSVGFGTSITNAASIATSWSASVDDNFKTYNAKLCSQNDCSTGCTSPIAASSSPASLSGTAGNSYYACIQAEDLAGHFSSWVPSLATISFDSSAPTVTNVTSPTADGHYKAGSSVTIEVEFSEPVFASNAGSISLQLETGATDHSATYASGIGTDTLLLTYSVVAGDTSADLNAKALNALTHSGTLRDAAGNDAVTTLPDLAGAASLATQKALIVDTTAPAAPAGVFFATAVAPTLSFDVEWSTASTDDYFSTHNVKICSNSNCSSGCQASINALASPATVTGVNSIPYYGCVRGSDLAGNLSAWVASIGTHTVDTANPTVVNVTSTNTDGIYKVGDTVSVALTFSKVISVTGSADIKLLLDMGANDREAAYAGGNGSNTLTFSYTIQAGDSSDDLDVSSINALTLGATGDIEDGGANDAMLGLPAPGDPQSLSGQRAIIIDTTDPTAPSSVSFASATTNAASISTSWTLSSDANLATHNLKLCSQNDCSTACTAVSQSASSPALLPGTAGNSYYACVQGEDLAGHLSAWVPSAGMVTFDTTAPTVVNVTSATANGYYKAGASIDIRVEFSEAVIASLPASLALELETGTNDHSATYVSGNNSNILVFTYSVQAGDTTGDLNAKATSSLTHSGTLRDASGNNAVLTLPDITGAASLATQHAIVLDTTAPSLPTTPTFASANGESLTFNLSWGVSTDTNFSTHNAKICTASDCSTACISDLNSVGSPALMTGVHTGVYYGCVRGADLAGNLTSWVATAGTHSIDASNPTVTSVTSTAANGAYNAGDSIELSVVFSKVVYVTGDSDIDLLLETGGTDTHADYLGGSGSNTLTFTYQVQPGDTSADLEIQSTGALGLGATGDIQDSAAHNAVLTLPTFASGQSLAALKQFVIDTTNPTAPSSIGFASAATNAANISTSWVVSTDTNFSKHNLKLCTNSDCATGCTAPSSSLTSPANLPGVAGTVYYACVQGEDSAGNLSAYIASATQVTFDTSAPTVTNLSATTSDGFYKAGTVISLELEFSEPVYASNAASIAVELETGTNDRSAVYASGIGTDTLVLNYSVIAGDTASDLNAKALSSLTHSGTLRDAAGNDVVLTLPPLNGANALATQSNIVIDSTLPTAPATVSWSGATSQSTTISPSWTASSDTNFDHYEAKICTAADCSTSCSALQNGTGTTDSFTASEGVSYYACVRAADKAGNLSAFTGTAASINVDGTAPTVSAVTSSTADGYKTTGATLSIQVTFSEAVTVTNSAQLSLLLETGGTDHTASFSSVSGNTINFTYTVQSGDVSADLDYQSTAALAVGASGTIRDAAGNDATRTLPALGDAASLSGSKALVLDTTAPAAPSTVAFASSTVNVTTFAMTWTNGTDTNFSTHNIKLCSVNTCTGTCESVGTDPASPANVTGTVGPYYGCVQAVDLAGLSSAWIPSASTVLIDQTAPSITNLRTTNADGYYKTSDTIVLDLQFSEDVVLTNASAANIRLYLETGPTDRYATYDSQPSADKIRFNYVVLATDTTQDLNAHSATALTLSGGATVKDAAGNSATITALPTSGANSLAAASTIVIDTTNPTAPTNVQFPAAFSTSTGVSLSWTASTDTNLKNYKAKLCTASNCTSCLADVTTTASPASLTGSNATSYYGCVEALDESGNSSTFQASAAAIAIDTSVPTVSSVTTSTGNASYNAGDVITILVNFSETVDVTTGGALGLLLETGTPDRTAVYSTGTGTSSLTFLYTVEAGDTTSDLNYVATSSLTLGAGFIKDLAGNNASLSLPATNNAASLGGSAQLIIDTTAPNAPVISVPATSYSTTQVTTISGTAEAGSTVAVRDGVTLLGTAVATGGNWSLDLSATPLTPSVYSITAKATDAAGNESAASTSLNLTVDTTGPTAPVVGALVSPTNDTTPTIFGTSEPGMLIKIYKAAVEVASTTADGSGNWSTSPAAPFAESTSTITATATDPGNRVSAASNGVSMTVDTTAPTVSSLTSSKANSTYGSAVAIDVQVVFSEAVIVTGSPQIEMECGSSDPFATTPTGSGTSTLSFSFTTAIGHTTSDLDVKATTALSGGTIKDAAGNSAVLTLPMGASAGSLKTNKDIAIDGIAPTVQSVTTTTASGSYGPTNVIPIQVTFSKAVTVTGTPRIQMNTSTPANVDYSSGSTTTVLTFNYTVPTVVTSADFDHVATSSLTLNTGTIKDAYGNDATLTLPAPGTAVTTIGGTKNIVIAGTSTVPVLTAVTPTQNAYSDVAITSVNVNGNASTDNDADGQAITYACHYDQVVDSAMSSPTACASLPNTAYSFNTATGVLTWTPSAAAVASTSAVSPYEFRIQGTDTTHLTGTVYFTVNLIKPFVTDWTFATPSDYTYGQYLEITAGKARLKATDQTDDADDTGGYAGGTKTGITWNASGYIRLNANANGCDSSSSNCSEIDSTWMNTTDNIHQIDFNNSYTGVTVTNVGSPSFSTTRKLGSHSLYLNPDDGSNDAIQFARSTLGDNMTVSFWMMSTQALVDMSCISFFDGAALVTTETATTTDDWGISLCDGYIVAGVGNPDTSMRTTYKHNDGKWHHVALTRTKSSGLVTFYVDSIKQGTLTGGTQTLSANANIRIGNSSSSGNFYKGYIDGFFTMGVALTETQIQHLYERQASGRSGIFTSRAMDSLLGGPNWTTFAWETNVPAGKQLPDYNNSAWPEETPAEYAGVHTSTLMSGNVGLWHFSETSGTTIDDDSPTNATCTITGGTAGTNYNLGKPGRFGTGIEFLGGSNLNCGTPAGHDLGAGSFSVAAWIKVHGTGTTRIFQSGYWGSSTGIVLMGTSDGTGRIGFGLGATTSTNATSTLLQSANSYNDGAWHHVVGVVNRSTNRMMIYVDGVKANVSSHWWGTCGSAANATDWNISACPNLSANSADASVIGGDPGHGNAFYGRIDEVGLWSRAFSDDDVKALFRRGSDRIKFQVRSCTTTACTGIDFKGPDGTKYTYYTEMNNNTSQSAMTGFTLNTPPTMTFSNFAGNGVGSARYLQYRAILEADDTNSSCTYGNCSPELISVTAGPDHYDGAAPTLVSPARPFYTLTSLAHTLGSAGCANTSGVKFQLSTDASTWKYWNGTAWVTATNSYSQANTPALITTNATTFKAQVGTGNVYFRAYFPSNGQQACELEKVDMSGNYQY